MDLRRRIDWGARPPRRAVCLDPARVRSLFVHHTTGSGSSSVAWLRSIQNFHQAPAPAGRGWADIAYSWLVDSAGVAWEGRGWELVGAHTAGHNSSAVGIAFLGDGRRPVPPAALATIRALADEADARFGRQLARRSHRDVSATVCPGDVLAAWVAGCMPLDQQLDLPATPRPVLRRGARGPDVADLQRALGGLAVDGIFGPATERAVRAYQQANGLGVDGIVGPQTWGSLRHAM